MLKYLIKLGIYAAILWLVVWYGIPLIHQEILVQYKNTEELNTSKKNEEKTPDTVAKNETTVLGERTLGERTKKISESISEITRKAEEKIETTIKNLPSPEEVISNVIETVTSGKEESQPLPEMEKYVAERIGSRYRWGIAITNSPAYDTDMNHIGYIQGGTIVEQLSSQLFPEGYISKCSYVKTGEWQELKVYLYDKDIILFNEPLSESRENDRALLIKYCTLYGQREELRSKLYNELLKRNPYLPAYQRVREELSDFQKQNEVLKTAHQAAEGAQRVSLEDQLRKRKPKTSQLVAQYEEIKAQYDKWSEVNLGSGKNINIPKIPELEEIEKEMESIREEVHKIVPGL